MPQLTRAFRHRNYQLFFSGQLISLTGTWMQTVAESWLVYRLTGSSALLGVAAFASQIPIFLFATIGGTVADRFNRHRIIIVTQSLSMVLPLVLAALTFTGVVRVWHVLTLAACLGLVNAFDVPARQAFFVEMVGHDDLMNAIALNSSMVNGARVVGPALAGILVAAVGESWCFLLNGISYVAVIAGLLMMNVPARPKFRRHTSPVRDTLEGFQFVVRTAPVRAILLLLGIISLAGMPYTVLMPIFADQILGGGARHLGLLMGAAGLGALGGALSLAAPKRRPGTRQLGRHVGRGVWSDAYPVLDVARVLAFGGAPRPGWHGHDGRDGLIEHAHSSDGARRAPRARNGRLLDDVHGHGAVRCAHRRVGGRTSRRAVDRGGRWTRVRRRCERLRGPSTLASC